MGKIVLVTVPIGNSADITNRALTYLKSGEYFAVEDTRSFRALLKKFGIETEGKKIDSFHDQSGESKQNRIIKLAREHDVYVVSEAGSPYLSDPAYPLVKQAINENIPIKTTGGINAVTYALELSGFPANPFKFHGFIARDSGPRQKCFKQIMSEAGTHIFFEGVSRVDSFLKDLATILPEANVVVARELSKDFESVYRFKAKNFDQSLKEMVLKGEFVILVSNENPRSNEELRGLAESIIKDKGKKKTVAKLLSQILDRPVNDIYAELGN